MRTCMGSLAPNSDPARTVRLNSAAPPNPATVFTVENGEHGLAGADPADIDAASEEAVVFVLNQLR